MEFSKPTHSRAPTSVKALRIATFLTFLAALTFSHSALAGFSECDALLTESEKESRKILEMSPPLAAIFGAFDTCTAAKSFFNRIAQKSSNGRSSISNEQIELSLEEEGLPAAGIRNCLWAFNSSACREYLNRSRGPTERPVKEIADEYAMMLGATSSASKKFGVDTDLAQRGIVLCENALGRSNRFLDPLAERNCQLAEDNIKFCLSTQISFKANQAKLQAIIDSGKLGDTAPQYMVYTRAGIHSCPTVLNLTNKSPSASLSDAVARFARADQASLQEDDPKVLSRGTTLATSGLQAATTRNASPELRDEFARNEMASRLNAEQRARDSSGGPLMGGLAGIAAAAIGAKNPTAAGQIRAFADSLDSGATSRMSQGQGNESKTLVDAGQNGPESFEQQSSPTSLNAAVGASSFDECNRKASNPELQAAFSRLDRSSATLMDRGAIAMVDYAIRAFQSCSSDARTLKTIQELKGTREQLLARCRQLASVDNCSVSPFGRRF